MRTYAVIVAGGSGNRMGAEIPKQFLPIHGIPVFIHTIKAFIQAIPGIKIIVVLPAAHMDTGKAHLDRFLPGQEIDRVEGGVTRFHSVQNGLASVEDDAIVFIHDAVRCMVSQALIHRCYQDALDHGSSIPVIELKDSIRKITNSGSEVVDRSILRAVQTPQTFRAKIIRDAFNVVYDAMFTDEATVLEKAGGRVYLTRGEETNIKITYPADLLIAEQFIQQDRS